MCPATGSNTGTGISTNPHAPTLAPGTMRCEASLQKCACDSVWPVARWHQPAYGRNVVHGARGEQTVCRNDVALVNIAAALLSALEAATKTTELKV